MHPAAVRFSRRAFIVGGGALIVAACGGGSESDSAGGVGGPITAGDPIDPFLAGRFPDGFRAPSVFVPDVTQRAPILIIGEDGYPLRDDAPDELEVTVAFGGTEELMTVARHGDGLPTPYYPLEFSVPEPGTVTASTVYQGRPLDMQFTVVDPSEVALVQVGDPMRPVDTPTFADARGVDPICTRQPEPCPYHEMTLTEALGTGRPVVFVVSTPAYCQTDVCGPTLELVMEQASTHPDLVVVHAEPWVNVDQIFEADGSTEAVDVYGLTFEPMLVAATSDGTVTTRLDWAFDRSEIAEAMGSVAPAS